MRLLYLSLITSLLFLSCKKDKEKAGKTVEIYLFKEHQVMAGKCQVDPALSVLQDTAIIKNQDILQYSKTEYQFKLTDAAIQKVKAFGDNRPFAVTVDKQVIYYGFYKPITSSSACPNSITMDFLITSNNKISVQLGYPGQLEGATIDDQRNNTYLIKTLKSQGKLN